MNLHKNGRMTPHAAWPEHQQPATRVAADFGVDFGVSERTVRKWPAQ